MHNTPLVNLNNDHVKNPNAPLVKTPDNPTPNSPDNAQGNLPDAPLVNSPDNPNENNLNTPIVKNPDNLDENNLNNLNDNNPNNTTSQNPDNANVQNSYNAPPLPILDASVYQKPVHRHVIPTDKAARQELIRSAEKTKLDVREKCTAHEVCEAIKGSYGTKSVIVRRLGISIASLNRYIRTYASVAAAFDEERERFVDLAESKILEAIENNDTESAWRVLRTLGRSRGYGDEVTVQQQFVFRIK